MINLYKINKYQIYREWRVVKKECFTPYMRYWPIDRKYNLPAIIYDSGRKLWYKDNHLVC